jgi:CBS domain-containing protein
MFVEQMLLRAHERLATVDAGTPVIEAAGLLSKAHTDIVVVCEREGGMVGVVTKTDIVGQIGKCNGKGCTVRVDTIMTRDVVCCEPSESLQDVWRAMKESGLQRVPLVDQFRKPIGIICARDALENLLYEVEDEESLLRDYVMSVGYR